MAAPAFLAAPDHTAGRRLDSESLKEKSSENYTLAGDSRARCPGRCLRNSITSWTRSTWWPDQARMWHTLVSKLGMYHTLVIQAVNSPRVTKD
ncbi:Uncharacterized protein DAT39_019933 [Clarias magur]|uniref:Uncharacterized protein n=1 Tax=Clarias magur TaxID=1594786 RepID=A0A8J4T7N2_CLAMG|nr:Uncharacterized protein DAT39_019933 [Clarias magur]